MQETYYFSRKGKNSREKLGFLAVLKFVAVILIIAQHVLYSEFTTIDLGARMCEFLIVSSGFLVGLNYIDKNVKPTLKASIKYGYKKFKGFYPLHFICLLLVILLEFSIGLRQGVDKNFVVSLICNLTLTHAWSNNPDVIFSFNGVSWFLPAILFCYLLSPFFLQAIKKVKTSIVLFCVVVFLRIMFEFLVVNYWKDFNINLHVNPLIKASEFFIGMLTVPVFNLINNKIQFYKQKRWVKVIFTLIEVLILVSLFFIIYYGGEVLSRGLFVFIFSLFVVLIALCCGYISDFCSSKIMRKMCSCQLEMYLFQVVVFYGLHLLIVSLDVWYITDRALIQFIGKILIIYLISAIYKDYISGVISKGLNLIESKFSFLKRVKEKTNVR